MSDTITQAFVQQFDSAIRMLSAQMESRFKAAVTDRGTITGDSFTANLLDPAGDMPLDTVRHGDTVFSDITHSARKALMKDYFDALPLDRADIPKMIVNPVTGGQYASTLVGKWNRTAVDKQIYRAARDSALNGDGTTTALPSAQKIAHGSAGFTKAKLITTRKLFRANELDQHNGEELFIAYTAEMLEDILSDTTLTSADFLAVQMLQEGDVARKWMGFNWIPFEGIDPVSSSTYYTIAWCKSAIHFGQGFQEGRVDRRPDKKNLFQTSLAGSTGAVRAKDKGVVEIAYQL
jgi:hypothetical protein